MRDRRSDTTDSRPPGQRPSTAWRLTGGLDSARGWLAAELSAPNKPLQDFSEKVGKLAAKFNRHQTETFIRSLLFLGRNNSDAHPKQILTPGRARSHPVYRDQSHADHQPLHLQSGADIITDPHGVIGGDRGAAASVGGFRAD